MGAGYFSSLRQARRRYKEKHPDCDTNRNFKQPDIKEMFKAMTFIMKELE